jgi:hypothetical protein
MRLEKDPRTLVEALTMVLEGFEAYLATGFEPDGGSIEGIGYWNYGLMYYATLAELLREHTGGQFDLLAAPRLKDIARYPLVVALSPGIYLNFGDATEEELSLALCTSRRTHHVDDLRALLCPERLEGRGIAPNWPFCDAARGIREPAFPIQCTRISPARLRHRQICRP